MKSVQDYIAKCKEIVKETGYAKVAVLLVAGLVLVLLSVLPMDTKGEKKEENLSSQEVVAKSNELDDYVDSLEERLEKVLADVDKVGDVEVMITLKSSSETVLNKDVSSSSQSYTKEGEQLEESGEQKEETVLVEEENGATSPYVIKKIEPEIAGIVVICEGGDQPYVIQEITSAAEVLFSVSAHKVKVMKKLTT